MSKRDKLISRILTSAIIVLLVFYGVYNAYQSYAARISLETADIVTASDVIDTKAFIVRDEVRLDANGDNRLVLKSSSDGVFLPVVSDGSMMAENDTVALSFASAADAQNYSLLEQLDSEIDYYNRLQKQSVLSSVDVGTLNNRIEDYVDNYVACVESGKLERLSDASQQLEHALTSRQIATGEKLDFSATLEQLNAQRSALAAKNTASQSLTTAYSGYFVGYIDGYEQKVSYDKVSELSVKEIEKLLESEPAEIDAHAFGKVIGSYRWYVVCSVPDSTLMYLERGSKVTVSFNDSVSENVAMSVYSISDSSDGKVALVLACSLMDEALADMRIENVSITIKSYTGYKVGNSALRQNDKGDIGVYILYGNVVRFRKTDIIYYGNNYVIVAPFSEDSGEDELRLYDSVILKGRNLYDGKLIAR